MPTRYEIMLAKNAAKKAREQEPATFGVKSTKGTDIKKKKIKAPKKPSFTMGYRLSFRQEVEMAHFLANIADINSEIIRKEEMNNDAHAIVITDKMFKELLLDHKSMVEEVIRSVQDKDADADLIKFLNDYKKLDMPKLSARLRDKFIAIVDKEMKKRQASQHIKFKTFPISSEFGNGTIYYVEAGKKASTSPEQTLFKYLQDPIFKDVRQAVAKAATTDTSGIGGALAVTIVGIPLKIGDAVPGNLGNLAKGVVVDRAPKKSADRKKRSKGEAKNLVPIAGAGFQLGHLRGPNTVAADRLLRIFDRFDDGSIKFKFFRYFAAKQRDLIHKFDAELGLNDIVFKTLDGKIDGKIKVSIVGIEQAAKNSYSGSKAGARLKKLKLWLTKNAYKLAYLKASPPLVNLLLQDAVDVFLGRVAKGGKINKKLGERRIVKGKVNTSAIGIEGTPDRGVVRDAKSIANEGEATDNTDLEGLIDFVNSKLHDKIQQNMGKGGAKQILNYRTGRFAKSAKVQALFDVKDKNAIGARVKYMRHPYGVFEPKGRLHKPGRDPHHIFGRSIRQLLQEAKIANYRRVKVDLSG